MGLMKKLAGSLAKKVALAAAVFAGKKVLDKVADRALEKINASAPAPVEKEIQDVVVEPATAPANEVKTPSAAKPKAAAKPKTTAKPKAPAKPKTAAKAKKEAKVEASQPAEAKPKKPRAPRKPKVTTPVDDAKTE